MYAEIAKALPAEKRGRGEPWFSDARYEAKPLTAGNKTTINDDACFAKLSFIDGGNCVVLEAPDYCVSLVRGYYSVFEGGKRLKHEQVDFLVTATTRIEENGNKQVFDVKAKQISGKQLSTQPFTLDAFDPSVSKGGFAARCSESANVFRRYLEWLLAEKAIGELSAGDVVVRDGTLQTSVVGEGEYAKKTAEAAKSRGVLLTALAKTSGLVTTTGLPLVSAVAELCGEGKWFYSGFVENKHPDHEAELFVCRLHASSKHAFRFEINREQAKTCDVQRVFALLADNSRDTAFLGYPYGLLDADTMARVTKQEAEGLKAVLKASNPALAESENAFNAHDYLY